MKTCERPQLLTDLYRDLRDRRLLLPAAVLAVALIAVPVALSSSAATAPTTPPTAPDAGASLRQTATEPAVLTRELGVTEYRKRLQALQSKNPFRQQFTLPEVTSKVEGSSVTEPVGDTTALTTPGGGSSTTEPVFTRRRIAAPPRRPPQSPRAAPRRRACTCSSWISPLDGRVT